MESPVVLDKPPEYHERGFPFDEEEGSGAWSELASRHPDIAARLRQRPATWARKRRPSSQDGVDDTADSFGGFDRFPFDDIPQEFREHFPSHWNRRFGSREEQFQPEPTSPQPQSPSQQTIATQTEQEEGPSRDEPIPLPQYGLRNTVDLGQKSPADPSVVDDDERTQRSMSAPPDHRTLNQNSPTMSGQNHQEQHQPSHSEQSSNVRHIPIFVEGRDEPVINKNVDHGTHFSDQKPSYVPPPQTHIDRENYFADDGPVGFPFAKSFDRPFFRQSAQPFSKQKMYPQSAFGRGASPQRSQSPKPQNYQEQTSPRAETPSRQQPQQRQPPPQQKQVPPQQKQAPPQQRQAPQQQKQAPPQQKQPPPQQRATSPQAPQQRHQTPPPHVPSANDPITQILSIQTDVLNLMTEVENFKGVKNDKQYLFLDEMLTRNLIKLDNIETEGKENIRQARKEAIRCIQKCIAVLEAKAESNSAAANSATAAQDIEMQNPENEKPLDEQSNVQNGDVDMKEATKEEIVVEPNLDKEKPDSDKQLEVQIAEEKLEDGKQECEHAESKQETAEIADTRPEKSEVQESTEELKSEPETNIKMSPKKTTKKRDKSKESKKKDEVSEKKEEEAAVDSVKEEKKVEDVKEPGENDKKESNENEINEDKKVEIDVMQIDAKGDTEKSNSQGMEVDGAASQ